MGRSPASACPADALVPQHLVWARAGAAKPTLQAAGDVENSQVVSAVHVELGPRWLYAEGTAAILFTENETNTKRLFGQANASPYVKDGINDYLVHGRAEGGQSGSIGTKAAAHYELNIAAGATAVLRLRLTDRGPDACKEPFADFDDGLRSAH